MKTHHLTTLGNGQPNFDDVVEVGVDVLFYVLMLCASLRDNHRA